MNLTTFAVSKNDVSLVKGLKNTLFIGFLVAFTLVFSGLNKALAIDVTTAAAVQTTAVVAAEEATHEASHDATANAAEEKHGEAAHEGAAHEKFNPSEVIKHHVKDAYSWDFFEMDGKAVGFDLPCLVYSPKLGLNCFSYAKIKEHGTEFEGYSIDHLTHKITREDGEKFYDISITKNVVSLLISAFLLLFIFIGVARKYAKNPNSAPSGFQSAIEPLILMIQEDVAKPMLGKKYLKFLPYLLTLFFFIWINNLLGLIPGGANLTGNTSVTAVLAGVTFFCIMAFSNKHYWGHIFAMPGVPKFVLIILTPVEILGIFIKPFALLIRLFANILAGHMIILTVVGLIFITAEMSHGLGWGTAVFSLVFGVFMFSIELLVAFVQAYIFTTLSALFISEAVAEHHHEEAHH